MNPAISRVCSAPSFVDAVIGTRLPFGATTKNSEVFETAPIASLGTQPPLSVEVAVRDTILKTIVEFPLLCTVTFSKPELKLAEVISKLVMSRVASLAPW